jgi:hypothetical protein
MTMEEYRALNDKFMDEVLFIFNGYGPMECGPTEEEYDAVAYFIGKCSLQDFEKLKDMDYELTNNDTDDTAE